MFVGVSVGVVVGVDVGVLVAVGVLVGVRVRVGVGVLVAVGVGVLVTATHEGNLNVPTRVRQDEPEGMYSEVYQNVQSSTGSTDMAL
jgi:hypothetical protein